MMAQGVLPFQYEVEPSTSGLTGLAGLPAYFELAAVVGMRESSQRYVCARDGEQGWSDVDMILSLILLNLAGGDCVDDIEKLAGDVGLCKVLDEVRWSGLSKAQRRERARRWRRVARTRAVASASSVRRYLTAFCSEESERPRPKGTSFIPAKTQALAGSGQVNAELVGFLQSHRPRRVATLDFDATMVECHKKQAQYGYKGFRAYQALNVWWAEQQVVVHSEFRDGNVTPGYEQLRVLQEALAMVPEGVEQVHMRSDTAGYQWNLLRYCEEGRNERFGRIEFVVGVRITEAFKWAIATTPGLRWHPLADSDHKWAEVCYVPKELGRTKKGEYRFFVIREPVRQLELFDDDSQLPFPRWEEVTQQGCRLVWKLRAVVTNRRSTPAPTSSSGIATGVARAKKPVR